MSRAQVHFEVFTRRRVDAPWSLELATEDRARALEAAEEMLASGHAAAVRVCKETLDEDTRMFKSVTLLSKGAVEGVGKRKTREVDDTPLCITPQDLYSVHARERIGRLLDGWLRRKSVTAFELLHRPDLVEALDASGVELQHAVQKIAIPEAQARGVSTHEIIRTFQKLIERAVERVIKDGKTKAFPDLAGSKFAAAAVKLAEEEAERHYILGGGVAAYLAPAKTWSEKVALILDLADQAPEAGRPRGLALAVLEQPLSEILGSRGGLADLLGADLDLGGSLAALTRLAAGASIKALAAYDPGIEKAIPPLAGQAARLEGWLQREAFETVRQGLTRRVLRELTGPRRLRPSDPDGEITILRALAMALTAASGKLLPPEEVQAAFIERSKMLVAGDFVEAFLAGRDSPLAEAEALVRLADNVAGSVNKRTAGRWLVAAVTALRFEKELRYGPDTPATKLSSLAALQRGVLRAGLAEADAEEVLVRLGEVASWIEADAKLIQLITRADAPVPHRLTLLLRLASGEAAPKGPVTERAKAEVLKLLRVPETRAELANAPEALERVKSLMTQAGLAA
jgi:hypothetical protein